MTIEVILCGRNLGTKKEPSIYGTCDNVSGHSGSCSSPELKAYRRNATAASRARAKKETDGDSIIEKCACGHTLTTCPNPKYCGLSRTQIEERQKREAAEAAEEAQRVAANIRKAEEQRYLADILNRRDAGEIISPEDQELFLSTCISYLGVPAKFSIDRDTRIRRALDVENRLSEALYGPSYTKLGEIPSRLDERSFPVRLGRFLNVADRHGSLNIAYRYHPAHKTAPITPAIPLATTPPEFTPGPPPGL